MITNYKLFENIQEETKLFVCAIEEDSINESDIYAFLDEESMNNFLIDYIHKDYDEANDTSIKYIFDIEKLIRKFNCDTDRTIHLDSAKLLNNFKLDSELLKQIEMSKKVNKYNI
jgi:hypothetical protein